MRMTVLTIVDEAMANGARRASACALIGLDASTLRRWRPANSTDVAVDQRPLAERPAPQHKLTAAERDEVVRICKLQKYSSLPPSQIVPKLADERQYVASESTFYRILRDEGLLQHRGRAQKAEKPSDPPRHCASRPNEVWTYDVTFLPSRVRGQFFYLYMIQDLCSRYGVHWEVHDEEHADHNARLIEQAVFKAGCSARPPILHSDNGSTMKSYTMRRKLTELGVTPSFSRPSVSNDNAFIESMFRTVKYCPQWPSGGFVTLEDARVWVHKFMHWYVTVHSTT
jgi:putative transposase